MPFIDILPRWGKNKDGRPSMPEHLRSMLLGHWPRSDHDRYTRRIKSPIVSQPFLEDNHSTLTAKFLATEFFENKPARRRHQEKRQQLYDGPPPPMHGDMGQGCPFTLESIQDIVEERWKHGIPTLIAEVQSSVNNKVHHHLTTAESFKQFLNFESKKLEQQGLMIPDRRGSHVSEYFGFKTTTITREVLNPINRQPIERVRYFIAMGDKYNYRTYHICSDQSLAKSRWDFFHIVEQGIKDISCINSISTEKTSKDIMNFNTCKLIFSLLCLHAEQVFSKGVADNALRDYGKQLLAEILDFTEPENWDDFQYEVYTITLDLCVGLNKPSLALCLLGQSSFPVLAKIYHMAKIHPVTMGSCKYSGKEYINSLMCRIEYFTEFTKLNKQIELKESFEFLYQQINKQFGLHKPNIEPSQASKSKSSSS